MTTISRVGSIRTPLTTGAARPSSGGFRLPETEHASSAVATAAVAGAATLLAAQAAGDALERDRRARREGEMALVDLRELQVAMLDGRDLAPLLGRLETLAITRPADPALREIIADIRLRIAVETAKRKAGRGPSPTP